MFTIFRHREMQNYTKTPSYSQNTVIKKSFLNPGKDTGKAENLYTISRNVNITVTMEIHMAILPKPKNRTAYGLVTLLPGMYSKSAD